MRLELSVQLTHSAVTTAERVTGVVRVAASRPVALAGPVEVTVRGEAMVHSTAPVSSAVDHVSPAGVDWLERSTFYRSAAPAECYDETRDVGAGSVTEYPPGRYLLPFSLALPADLPVSVRSPSGNEHLLYYVRACAHWANGQKDTWSAEVPLAVVANNAVATQERTAVRSAPRNGTGIACDANSVAAIGSAVRARIVVDNSGEGARDIDRVRVTLYGHHEFENCAMHVVHSAQVLPAIRAGSVLDTIRAAGKVDVAVPARAMPDAAVSHLQWKNQLLIEAVAGKMRRNARLVVPVTLVSPAGAPAGVLTALSAALKMPRDFAAANEAFRGAHRGAPPVYARSPECPPGWQQLRTESGTVFLDHTARACSDLAGGEPNGLAYPLWDSLSLPPGWTRAHTDSREEYFIDHVNGATAWADPRPAGSRAPTAASMDSPTLDVTVLRAKGLQTAKRKAVKTAAKKKTVDPMWTAQDRNTFRLCSGLETRNNVAVYVWDRNLLWDRYIGCVTVDVCRIPADTPVLQWHTVANAEGADCGSLLVRVVLHSDPEARMPAAGANRTIEVDMTGTLSRSRSQTNEMTTPFPSSASPDWSCESGRATEPVRVGVEENAPCTSATTGTTPTPSLSKGRLHRLFHEGHAL
eukprot:m51a1_g12385 hypothetical protein (638) ;mRNA; f:635961-638396